MSTTRHQFISHNNESCDGKEVHAEVMARTLRLIGDMWILMIIYNLMSGAKRFGELLDALGNVSPKTLSQRLKMLEEVQIVSRRAFAEIPPRVEYQLTEKGEALLSVLQAIQDFGTHYLSDQQAEPVAQSLAESLPEKQDCSG